MLLSANGDLRVTSLNDLLDRAEKDDPDTSYGEDIDISNAVLLDPQKSHEQRHAAFLAWASRYQPCLFGRLSSREMQGIGIDMCWIDEDEIALGDDFVTHKIQRTRREWKKRAAEGISHGFLIMFNGPRLARLRPGTDLLAICEKIAGLYLIEHMPIARDVIYTESIPLQGNKLSIFKAGINIFYPSAHRTRNHDRRIPGGLVISVNSPGHLANSLVMRGLAASLDEAVTRVMEIALRSIGNGGIGHDRTPSASWHNLENNPDCMAQRRKLSKLPHYVPENYSQRTYSALYHTDVLVPTDVTIDGTIDPDIAACEHWSHLILDYISEQEHPHDHINYALFHGHPIPDEALYHNPWSPRRAVNSPRSEV